MAALEVLALNESTPQIRAPGVGDTYTMPRALTVTGGITGAAGASFDLTSATSQNLRLIAGSGGTISANAILQMLGGAIWGRTSSFGIFAASASRIGFGSSSDNTGTNDTDLIRVGAGLLGIRNGSTGGAALSMVEQTAPSAPAANGVYIYAQDNGGGKTQLMALFSSGAAQQIAIEP